MTVRYLSICSGIEAATVAWHPLGWTPVAFSEIEKFPRAVLEHRFPAVPLHGDFTTMRGDEYGPVSLLVGGTPCQSFSIAGLRKGLADDRGNLALQFLALAGRARPRWIVWENVPGVLSSNGGRDFSCFMDGLEALGYICDVDILDAQFHGVPQRRRRVFVCGQHRDDLLRQKTDTSALTIAQCWLEILRGILAVAAPSVSGSERGSSDSAFLSKDGIERRMRLFGLHGGDDCLDLLRSNLAAALARYPSAPRSSDTLHGENEAGSTLADPSTASRTERPFTLTAASLASALGDSFGAMKSSITSTSTKATTPAEIFICSQAALLIAKLILRLNRSSPSFWSAASSALIAIEEFTNYARSASRDLFVDLERVRAWRDFIGEAEPAIDALCDIGIECFGEIFSLAESMHGHPPPRREAGERVAGTFSAGAHPGGYNGQDAHNDLIAHSLRADGFDASEDGTGGGTPLIVNGNSTPEVIRDCAFPLRANDGSGNRQAIAFGGNHTRGPIDVATARPQLAHGRRLDFESETFVVSEPLAFAQNSRSEVRLIGGDGQMVGSVAADHGVQQQNYIAFSSKDHGADAGDLAPTLRAMGHAGSHANAGGQVSAMVGSAVRRLTPEECEALQGFPRGWTLVPYRGKPAADGPRYKAIGNSMAVPVMRWIGKRIASVEMIATRIAA